MILNGARISCTRLLAECRDEFLVNHFDTGCRRENRFEDFHENGKGYCGQAAAPHKTVEVVCKFPVAVGQAAVHGNFEQLSVCVCRIIKVLARDR